VADPVAHVRSRQHAVAAASRYEIDAVLRLEQLTSEQSRAAGGGHDASGDDRAVLVTVALEQVAHQIAVHRFVQREGPRLIHCYRLLRNSRMRNNFWSALSVSARRWFERRDTWMAGNSKPGMSAPRVIAVGRFPSA